jgi:hypothetical protein
VQHHARVRRARLGPDAQDQRLVAELQLADALDADGAAGAGEVQQAGERGVVDHVAAVVAVVDLLVEVVLDDAVGRAHALVALAAGDGGAAALEHHHVPVALLVLDLVALVVGLAGEVLHPRVLRQRDLGAGLVLLAQRQREGDGVVADPLPAVGEGRAGAARLDRVVGEEAQAGGVRQRVRALDLAAQAVGVEDDVRHGAPGLEQLLAGREGLLGGDLPEDLRLEQGEERFEGGQRDVLRSKGAGGGRGVADPQPPGRARPVRSGRGARCREATASVDAAPSAAAGPGHAQGRSRRSGTFNTPRIPGPPETRGGGAPDRPRRRAQSGVNPPGAAAQHVPGSRP